MTQRAAVPCAPPDPRRVTGTVLVAPPQGGGPNPAPSPPGSAELWPGRARFTAPVRAEDAGFVDRRPFADGDETAFDIGATSAGASWTVAGGELRASTTGATVAVFGDGDWDHLTVVAGIAPGAVSAGIGFGIGAVSGAPRGLFVTVDTPAGGPRRLVVRRRASAGAALVELDAVELPAGGEDAVALEVSSFDDRLRAAVGEAVVEIDRGEIREGRLCLTATGTVTFRSLQVRGIDIYAFGFGVSRFASFGEHIASWDGRLDEIGPDALGPGTTTRTVAELWSATATQVAAVMSPAATSAEREAVFAQWVAGLGLALKDDVTQLELSRFAEQAQTRALLIESPEPIDFTEEVTIGLVARRRTGPGPLPFPRPPVGPVLGAATARRTLLDRFAELAAPPPRGDGGRELPSVDETILDVDAVGTDLRLMLHPALAGAGELAVVRVGDGGRALLYRGRVRPPLLRGRPAILQAAPFGALPRLPAGSELVDPLAGAPAGMILLASGDLLALLGRRPSRPAEVDVQIPVAVLQSGDGRRAIVVSLSGTAATALVAGPHRLTFSLARRRWDTSDAVDDVNTYARAATISLLI